MSRACPTKSLCTDSRLGLRKITLDGLSLSVTATYHKPMSTLVRRSTDALSRSTPVFRSCYHAGVAATEAGQQATPTRAAINVIMRYGAARSLQAASRRSVTACRRHASTISAVASSTKLPEKYFDHQQSWHYQEDGLQARRKKPRTMEDEWASAYRKAAGNTELEPEEAEQTYVASEPVSAKTRYAALKEQARAGNAQLSLDSGKDVGRENVNFRDLRVRTTTLDSHGEVSKRRAQIQKSLLCAQHNLQVRLS